MPIRLNLLAEAQAAEELRRRDPVKRSLWLAGLAIALILVWSSFLQLWATLANSEVTRIAAQMGSRNHEFSQIIDQQKKTAEIHAKLGSLQQLAAIRFLSGNFLNALQQTTVEDVQLVRLRVDQIYSVIEATKTRTNTDHVVVKGKPPGVLERTVFTLEGIDSSSLGDQVNRFTTAMTANSYFKDLLATANPVKLKFLSPPAIDPGTGKQCETFALECRSLEKTR